MVAHDTDKESYLRFVRSSRGGGGGFDGGSLAKVGREVSGCQRWEAGTSGRERHCQRIVQPMWLVVGWGYVIVTLYTL
jgi:hypothetical protein